MIRFLSIQNLAVVDTVELELKPGLTVLTGETGAGKSIILGALALLVGERSTSDLVRAGQSRARVQATIEENDGAERILRREVTAQGRSRAFIDDSLASAGALQAMGRRLLDLHGQHDHQALLDPASHLALLDAYAGFQTEIDAVASAFRTWRAARARLKEAQQTGRDRAQRIDMLEMQRDEIDRVQPQEDEDAELETRRRRLANAERLMSLCSEAYASLYEQDNAVVSELARVWKQVEELADCEPEFAPYMEARAGITAQLEDLGFLLRSYRSKIEASPADLAAVEERLSAIERLKRKYGPSLSDVRRHREQAAAELAALTAPEADLERLSAAEGDTRSVFVELATELGRSRRAAAARLSDQLCRLLSALAMPHAQFEIHFEPNPLDDADWSERGIDRAEFLFSANLGEPPRPLVRVASGGELSRVMLGIKTLASTDCAGKTLVFDEVDAGIGGATADRVGAMLRQMSETYQVVCVTHLPQIAAYATSHYHVSKIAVEGRTVTRVTELSDDARIGELARLMTGVDSPAARTSARELISVRRGTTSMGGGRKEDEIGDHVSNSVH